MMILRRADEVKIDAIEEKGASGVSIRWLIAQPEGASNFAMRLFDLAPGGYTQLHEHPWEHVVYILDGNAEVESAQGAQTVAHGDSLLLMPDERHQFRNRGNDVLRFLCMIPLKRT